MGTFTITPTYTKVDIRRTFTNFEADLRMIVLRTGKWTEEYMEKVCHDIYLFAEYGMLISVDITLLDQNHTPLRAAKFTVNENGTVVSGARPGSNHDWPNTVNSYLQVIVTNTKKYDDLSDEEKADFRSKAGFKSGWSPSNINTNYPHLTKESGQLYGNNGYELNKENFK